MLGRTSPEANKFEHTLEPSFHEAYGAFSETDRFVHGIIDRGAVPLAERDKALLTRWTPSSLDALDIACDKLMLTYRDVSPFETWKEDLLFDRFQSLSQKAKDIDPALLEEIKLQHVRETVPSLFALPPTICAKRLRRLQDFTRQGFDQELIVKFIQAETTTEDPHVPSPVHLSEPQAGAKVEDNTHYLTAKNLLVVTTAATMGATLLAQPAAANTTSSAEIMSSSNVNTVSLPAQAIPKSSIIGTAPGLTLPHGITTEMASQVINIPNTDKELTPVVVDSLSQVNGPQLGSEVRTYVTDQLGLAPTPISSDSLRGIASSYIVSNIEQSEQNRSTVNKALTAAELLAAHPGIEDQVSDDPVLRELMSEIEAQQDGPYQVQIFNQAQLILGELLSQGPSDLSQYSEEQVRMMATAMAVAQVTSSVSPDEIAPTPTIPVDPGEIDPTTPDFDAPAVETPQPKDGDKPDKPGDGKNNPPKPADEEPKPSEPKNNDQPRGPKSNGGKGAESGGGEHGENLSEKEMLVQAAESMSRLGPEWRNRGILFKLFLDRGYSPIQISGMIGNFCVEAAGCELDPGIQQYGGGPGRGIVQWGSTVYEYDRFGYDGLQNLEGQTMGLGEDHYGTLRWFAKQNGGAWDDLSTQIRFIDWELNNTEKAGGDRLRNAKDLYGATDAILNGYERPAERIIGLRLEYARGTFAKFQEILKDVRSENKEVKPPHDEGKPPKQEFTGEVPDNQEARVRYYADRLGIRPDQIHLSKSNAGLFHFTIDRSAYGKLGIRPLSGYPRDWQVPDSGTADPWNFFIGQCVSYVAHRVENDKYPGGIPNWGGNYTAPYEGGNATAWDDNARVDNVPVDKRVAKGAVLQWNETGGPEHTFAGHVGYIEIAFPEENWGVYSQMNYDGQAGWNVEIISPQMIEAFPDQINIIHLEKGVGNNQ